MPSLDCGAAVSVLVASEPAAPLFHRRRFEQMLQPGTMTTSAPWPSCLWRHCLPPKPGLAGRHYVRSSCFLSSFSVFVSWRRRVFLLHPFHNGGPCSFTFRFITEVIFPSATFTTEALFFFAPSLFSGLPTPKHKQKPRTSKLIKHIDNV